MHDFQSWSPYREGPVSLPFTHTKVLRPQSEMASLAVSRLLPKSVYKAEIHETPRYIILTISKCGAVAYKNPAGTMTQSSYKGRPGNVLTFTQELAQMTQIHDVMLPLKTTMAHLAHYCL